MAGKIRVLVVEDYEDAREMYVEFLKADGFEVHAAADGLAGLEMVRTLRPDVLVLDFALPKLDGFSVLREIRSDPHISGTPVLTLSASAGKDYADRAMRTGATAVLTKPCLPDDLARAIRVAHEKRARES
jgi:two-component system cell cycle response regulator DivK